MANIRKRGNSYQIRVSCGYDSKGNQVSKTMTWKRPEGMTDRQADKTSLLKIRLNSHISPQENRCTKASTAVSVVRHNSFTIHQSISDVNRSQDDT